MNKITKSESIKITAEPLHKRAAAIIREMIIGGQLSPGEQIQENSLCDDLGISRTPLREALKALEAEGLVTLLPRRGAIVTEITSEHLEDMFELAMVLEVHAVKILCEKATEKQIESLEKIHRKLVSSHNMKRYKDYITQNEAFHVEIIKIAGNSYIRDIHNSLIAHLRRARVLGMKVHVSNDRFVAAHEKIMAAIKRRDTKVAQEELANHQTVRKNASLEMLKRQNS